MSLEGVQGTGGGRVPDEHLTGLAGIEHVAIARGQHLAAGSHAQAPDGFALPAERVGLLPAGQGPVLDRLVIAGRDERAAMGSEDYGSDTLGMALKCGQWFLARNIPELDGCIGAAGGEGLTLRVESHREDFPGVSFEGSEGLMGLGVPEPDAAVLLSAGDGFAVGAKGQRVNRAGGPGPQSGLDLGLLRRQRRRGPQAQAADYQPDDGLVRSILPNSHRSPPWFAPRDIPDGRGASRAPSILGELF
jgi:hypothetical protein